MQCYKCGKDTNKFNGCKCNETKSDYQNNCEILKRKGYVFDKIRNEWVKKNKFRQIKVSDDAVKQAANFEALIDEDK